MRSTETGKNGIRGGRWLLCGLACVVALAGCGEAATSVEPIGRAAAPATSAAASASASASAAASLPPVMPVTGLDGAIVHGVAPFKGGVVAVGSLDGEPAAWTSDDGGAWEPAQVQSGGEVQSLRAVAFAEAGVAFGGDDAAVSPLWTSADGSAWQHAGADNGIKGRVNAVDVDGDRWVAAGDIVDDESGEVYKGAVWTSHDGRSWEKAADVALGEGTVSDVAVAGDTTVVGGFDVTGGKIWTAHGSADFAPADSQEFAAATIQGVAATGDGFVAVGRGLGDQQMVAWTSADGVTWTREEIAPETFAPDEEINELATVGERIFAVGATPQGGAVWTSQDGLSWSAGS